mgnify:CR=1 FL=1
MTFRSRWEFVVSTNPEGDVQTAWTVVSDEQDNLPTESEYGVVQGPLHSAILEAYDRMGLICPLTLDPDLLRWGGHSEEGRL